MQVSRWGNSLAIRLPVALVEALALKEGDDIDVRIVGERTFDLNRAPTPSNPHSQPPFLPLASF
jgi:antitoxin MazE